MNANSYIANMTNEENLKLFLQISDLMGKYGKYEDNGI